MGGPHSNAQSLPILFPFYCILLSFQLIVLIHFVLSTYGLRISLTIKSYALAILICVLIELSFEFVLTFPFPIDNAGFCFIFGYIRFVSFMILECTLFLFWVIRLTHTFSDSVLALSTSLTRTLMISIPSICIIFSLIIGLFLSVNSSPNMVCSVEMNNTIKYVMICSQIFAIAMNIFFALFFYRKLHAFAELTNTASGTSGGSKERTSVINVLIQKHTLLALMSVFSAVTAYVVFDIFLIFFTENYKFMKIAFLLIDIDMFIKSVCCILMFKFYEKKFYKLCFLCIRCASMVSIDCCYCFSKNGRIMREKSMFDALNQKRMELIVSGTAASYDDFYGEDCDYKSAQNERNIMEMTQNQQLNVTRLDDDSYEAQNKNEYLVGEYRLLTFMAKVKREEQRSHFTNLQFAIANQRVNDDIMQELFDKIYLKNGKTGHITFDTNCDDNTNNLNNNLRLNYFYFIKENQCKYPFAIALKIETNKINDGYFIAKYVEYTMKNKLDSVLHAIDDFDYQPFLQSIAQSIRAKRNLNIPRNANHNQRNTNVFHNKPNIKKESINKYARKPLPQKH